MSAGVPYEISPVVFQAPGGQPTCVAIDFPSRSLINKLLIVQTDGETPVAITAALYNNRTACVGQHVSLSATAGGGAFNFPPDLFRVSPDFTSTVNGKLFYFSETQTGGHGLAFFNHDAPINRQPGDFGNPHQLYLMITPGGAGNYEFAAIVGGEVFM